MDLIDSPFIKINENDRPRPRLPVTILNPHNGKSVKVVGLIDTGADECAIPAGYASLLGHNLQEGEPTSINTGNGVTTAFKHTVCFDIGGIKSENILIDFMPNLHVVLLGVESFLSNYIVTIDYKKQLFSLRENKK